MRKRQNSKRRRRKSSSVKYQQFEQRKMLAGDIRVAHTDGTLFIRGDNADNQVEIVATQNGDVRVLGQNGTTINGRFTPLFLRNIGGTLEGLRANLGRGNDTMFVQNANISGDSNAIGGSGDDSIGFFRVDFAEDLFVQTGSGNDSVSFDDVEVNNLRMLTLDGNDNIGIDESTINGRTFIATGNGRDSISIRQSEHVDGAILLTQSGNDFLGTDGATIGGFAGIYTGIGSDDVYVNDTAFEGNVRTSGQSGHDRLEVDGSISFANDPIVRSYEGDDVAGGKLQIADGFTSLIANEARLGTITELAVLTPQLSTLVGALTATGLDAALNGPGPFTVFAPLNSAFDALPDGTVEGLTNEQLTDVLTFHVANGFLWANQVVASSSIDTLLGQSFSVDLSSGTPVLNGNATIAQTNIRAKNGVIHLINDVLLPG